MKSYDTVVMGAGIAGLSVARELAKLGERVLVIERDAQGGNSSRAAAGILDPYTETAEETPLLQLGLAAEKFYPGFLRGLGPRASQKVEYTKLGILYLASNHTDEKFLKRRFEWQRRKKIPVEFLTAREVRKEEPAVSAAQSGVFYPEIAKLCADKLTNLLFQATHAAGVRIQTSVKESCLWMEKGRVRGIKIRGASIEARAVVLAAGCWSGSSLPKEFRIRVKPVRGQILILKAPPPFYPRHILHSVRYAYIVPWPKRRLLVGSTLESAGFKSEVTAEGRRGILKRASELVEAIHSFPIETSWAGLRPCPERGLPLIGPAKTPGLFLATGYYRSGILIGPWVGKLLAAGIHSGKFSPALRPFFPK